MKSPDEEAHDELPDELESEEVDNQRLDDSPSKRKNSEEI
jgi:hypothetical protein